MYFWAAKNDNHFIFKNKSLVLVTTVPQTSIIFTVDYDMHILQNLCVV